MLQGRRAVVTGGTKGTGAAVTSWLRSRGARVTAVARHRGLQEHDVITADLTSPAEVQRVAAAVQ
jgi:NAD(P)-dependent dehydrogenase (short-subunit alcohol dehydrogenase family)